MRKFTKVISLVICAMFMTCIFSACDIFTTYSLSLLTNNTEICKVVGAGEYLKEKQVTIKCIPNENAQDYDFLGWFNQDIKVSPDLTFTYTTSSSATSLLAKWSNKKFNVKLFSNTNNTYTPSDEPINEIRVESQTDVNFLPQKAEGYIFKGWYLDTNLTNKLSDDQGNVENIEYSPALNLYAKWQAGYYTLNISANIDETTTYVENPKPHYDYKDIITVNTSYLGELYSFEGWFINNKLVSTAPRYTFEMPLDNVTIVAKYSAYHDYNYEMLSPDTIKITKCFITEDDIYIPEYYQNKKVTTIGTNCFKDVSAEKIIIPLSIQSIEDECFYGNTANIYFDYGSNISLINSNAFTLENNIYANVSFYNTNNSLIDNYYCVYQGRYADTILDSEQEHTDMYYYLLMYGINNGIKLKINYAYDGTMETYINSYLNRVGGIVDFKNTFKSNFTYNITNQNGSEYITYTFTNKSFNICSVSNSATMPQAKAVITKYKDNLQVRKLYIEQTGKYQSVINSEQLLMAVSQGYEPIFVSNNSAKQAYARAKEILKTICTDEMTDYQKVCAIHDYIAINNTYDITLLNIATGVGVSDIDKYRGFYLEGTLLDRVSVCDGISKTFMLLCNMEGIECIKVIGNLHETGHAWNKVKLFNNWYCVDVTNDDVQVISGGTSEKYEVLSHKLFLVSDSELVSFGDIENPYFSYPTAPNSLIENYFTTTYFNETESSNYDLKLETLSEANALKNYFNNNIEFGEKFCVECFVPNSLNPGVLQNILSVISSFTRIEYEIETGTIYTLIYA